MLIFAVLVIAVCACIIGWIVGSEYAKLESKSKKHKAHNISSHPDSGEIIDVEIVTPDDPIVYNIRDIKSSKSKSLQHYPRRRR